MSAQWSPTRCGCGIRSETGAVPKPSAAEAGETRSVLETISADVADPARTKCSIAGLRPEPGRKVHLGRYGQDPTPLCAGYPRACRTRVDSAAPGIRLRPVGNADSRRRATAHVDPDSDDPRADSPAPIRRSGPQPRFDREASNPNRT